MMSWKDIPSWKYINPQKVELSPDGKWLAYPKDNNGKGEELILRAKDKDTITRKYSLGGDNQPSFEFSKMGSGYYQASSFFQGYPGRGQNAW